MSEEIRARRGETKRSGDKTVLREAGREIPSQQPRSIDHREEEEKKVHASCEIKGSICNKNHHTDAYMSPATPRPFGKSQDDQGGNGAGNKESRGLYPNFCRCPSGNVGREKRGWLDE
ncbi:hypothetical protein KM043_015302 [Ampulex compressa]|nr:hypothetical protein KM043_015302 [Ampulex compressa]